MALKAELETLDGLSEHVQKEYKQIDRGGKKVFILDIEGDDLPDEIPAKQALRKARDHERNARNDAEQKFKNANTKVEQLQNEIDEMRRGNIPKGDVEKLEKSWGDKLTKKQAEFDEALKSRDDTLRSLLVDNVAQKMATELSGDSAHLILPHIQKRLTTEIRDGKFETRVLDQSGKPSALSIEELQKEFREDKRYGAIIVGSKASGSGAPGGNGTGGPGSRTATVDFTKFNPNQAKPGEMVAALRQKHGDKLPSHE